MHIEATPQGCAAYKKKDGTLYISEDLKHVVWAPAAPGAAEVRFSIVDITNLQQTPETAAKVMLKILVKSPDAPEPVGHTFHFNAPTDPREEASLIRDTLSGIIAAQKAADAEKLEACANGEPGASPAMAIASAIKSKHTGAPTWYDDNALMNDFELQDALMKKDPMLQRTLKEARRTKPDTITNTQFNKQFWSTRINLLRSFAVERNQQLGAYNVLSAVKPRQEDGELKLRISKEQIQLIFNQHPLVKRVYDENVPKLDDSTFWSRFFLSRLFKKLKGERIVESDTNDAAFDRYLDQTNGDILQMRLQDSQIPNLIDIEGNEENQGGSKRGNRQDFTMRPSSFEKAPIIRTLNSLSEKIMQHVAQTDNAPTPVGMDEKTFNELALRDLQGGEEEHRIVLNYKQQSQFFSGDESQISEEAKLYANQNPDELILNLVTELSPELMDTDAVGGLDLKTAIGFNEESDSEEEEDQPKVLHVGSKKSLIKAQKQVFDEILYQRARIHGDDAKSSLSGLSQSIFDRLTLTHATTTEFLHHFWTIFLSGDADRAGELAKLVETLDRALDRINAVAADAETERNAAIEEHKRKIMDHYERTGKRVKFHKDAIGGGEKVVREMLEPTVASLGKATDAYRKALAAATVDGAV